MDGSHITEYACKKKFHKWKQTLSQVKALAGIFKCICYSACAVAILSRHSARSQTRIFISKLFSQQQRNQTNSLAGEWRLHAVLTVCHGYSVSRTLGHATGQVLQLTVRIVRFYHSNKNRSGASAVRESNIIARSIKRSILCLRALW